MSIRIVSVVFVGALLGLLMSCGSCHGLSDAFDPLPSSHAGGRQDGLSKAMGADGPAGGLLAWRLNRHRDSGPRVRYQIPPESAKLRRYIEKITIREREGEVVFQGTVDLLPTFRRIRGKEPDPHRRDGTVFGNREGLLPDRPHGYYREYVVRTPGLDTPGPQRLVTGREGEVWYTPDHYRSFIPLHK
jgi:hypothetical protein